MIKSKIGNKISSIRKDRGLSQAELAKAVGVGRSTISSWETDRTEPSMQDVERIAQVLDWTKEDIVGDYRKALFEDAMLRRLMAYWRALSEMQKTSIVEQAEYLNWKNKEEEEK